MVIGAMAPARQNGVMITGWPWRAKSMMPCAIERSSTRGELLLITV